MSSFAPLRRWISGIFRLRAELAANRKIMSSGEPPWLMVHPTYSNDEAVFKFWCCAKDEIYSFFRNDHKSGGEASFEFADAWGWKMNVVGSSHGWLALYDNLKNDLYLVDPTTHRDIGPIETMLGEHVHSVILSEGKIFMIFGSDYRLAFCSLRRSSREWTLFGDETAAYESVVYSSTHRRLFGITSTLKLEAWDVGGDSPRLDNDWEFDDYDDYGEGEGVLLKYLVCEEKSGDLYVVVRHVKHGVSTWVEDWGGYVGPTVDFKVYKIDRERGRLMKMVDSLGGLAIFVGCNHPIAIKIKDDDDDDDNMGQGQGVKPNSIYFAYDRRVTQIDSRDNETA